MSQNKDLKQLRLTSDQINHNINIFAKTNEKYNIFSPELIEFLGEDLFTAPASTMLDLHNCFPGGLLDHLIRVTKYATNFNKVLPENLQQSAESIVKVAFLSEIGKVRAYVDFNSDWHRKNMGKYYDYNNDLVSMRIGERSAIYALSNNVTLTEEEYQAIVTHDKDDDMQVKWHSGVLSDLLKLAIKFAIIEEKELWRNIQ